MDQRCRVQSRSQRPPLSNVDMTQILQKYLLPFVEEGLMNRQASVAGYTTQVLTGMSTEVCNLSSRRLAH